MTKSRFGRRRMLIAALCFVDVVDVRPPGSAGQSAVNGLRPRGNNFTVDVSDNNDEDMMDISPDYI